MVFGMCEGATDGCRRLIKVANLVAVQHGDTLVHGRFALPNSPLCSVVLTPYKVRFKWYSSCSRSDFWNTHPFHLVFLLIDVNCCE